jgi:hypothetical protein
VGAPREEGVQGEPELGSVVPVEAHLRVAEPAGEDGPGAILELVGAPVEDPDFELEPVVGLRSRHELLGQDLEVVAAAAEARDEDQDRVGLHVGARRPQARVAGAVQAEVVAAELLDQARVADDDARRAGRVRGLGEAGDPEGLALQDDLLAGEGGAHGDEGGQQQEGERAA